MSAVIFAVVTAVASIQAKNNNEMFSLREIIEKFLLVREFLSATPFPDPDTTPKALPGNNSLPNAITERWYQVDLGYFEPHLDRVLQRR